MSGWTIQQNYVLLRADVKGGLGEGDSLRSLGADALQRVPLASNLLGIRLRCVVRVGAVDAAILGLVGIRKEVVSAVAVLQGRLCQSTFVEMGVWSSASLLFSPLSVLGLDWPTSVSEGRRPPKQEAQMPMEWMDGS